MSKTIKYDKLIRDKIPEIIESSGKSCEVSVLNDTYYKRYLYNKLIEEVYEFIADDNIEELADISEVLLAILRLKGLDFADLEEVRLRKLEDRGGFEKRLCLKSVEDLNPGPSNLPLNPPSEGGGDNEMEKEEI